MQLEQRVNRLERSAKVWRGIAVVLGMALIAAAKAPVSDEVVTRNLKVVDNDGRPIFVVETTPGKNWPSLRFMVDGKDAISMNAADGASTMRIHNQSGGAFLDLMVDRDVALFMANQDEKKLGAGLGVNRGEGVITIYDKNHQRTLERPSPR